MKMLTFLSVLALSLSAFAQVDQPEIIFEEMAEDKYENCFIDTSLGKYNQLQMSHSKVAYNFLKDDDVETAQLYRIIQKKVINGECIKKSPLTKEMKKNFQDMKDDAFINCRIENNIGYSQFYVNNSFRGNYTKHAMQSIDDLHRMVHRLVLDKTCKKKNPVTEDTFTIFTDLKIHKYKNCHIKVLSNSYAKYQLYIDGEFAGNYDDLGGETTLEDLLVRVEDLVKSRKCVRLRE